MSRSKKNFDPTKILQMFFDDSQYEPSHVAASRKILKDVNREKNENEIDLHEQTVDDAIDRLHEKIISSSRLSPLTVIVGKGKHSPNGRPKIKPAVLEYAKDHGIHTKAVPGNDGRIIFDFNVRC